MDFDWFYYISTVQLRMTESEFWKCTPKKVSALWEIHSRFSGFKMDESAKNEIKEGVSFIDNIPFL